MVEPTVFEWDDVKAAGNLIKHGVDFSLATQVFSDASRVDYDVSRLEDGETRRKCVGVVQGRLMVVVYTLRGETFRIVSARPVNLAEARRYGDR